LRDTGDAGTKQYALSDFKYVKDVMTFA